MFKNLKKLRRDSDCLFHGRWFRNTSDMAEFDAPAVEVSAYTGHRWSDFRAELTVGGEGHDLTQSLKLPFTPTLYVHLCNAMPGLRQRARAWAAKTAQAMSESAGRRVYPHELDPFASPRATGVYLYENHLVGHLWADTMSWSAGANKVAPWRSTGWCWSIFVDDAILGRAAYTSEARETHETTIPMPEKDYPATVELTRGTWARPRGLRRKPEERAYVTIHSDGIPVPGKGENSWDCDENAIHAGSFPAKSLTDARLEMMTSAMRTRLRYGGEGWRPEAIVAAPA